MKSKRNVWIIGALLLLALAFFVYYSFAFREGNEPAPAPAPAIDCAVYEPCTNTNANDMSHPCWRQPGSGACLPTTPKT